MYVCLCVCWGGGGGGRRRGGDCTMLLNALRVILNNVKSGVFFRNLCGERDLQRARQNDFFYRKVSLYGVYALQKVAICFAIFELPQLQLLLLSMPGQHAQ